MSTLISLIFWSIKMEEAFIAPKIEEETFREQKQAKHAKIVDPELMEAEEEFKMALMGVTPRKRRLKIRDKEIEMSNHPENSTYDI